MDTIVVGELGKMSRVWLPLCLGVILLLSLVPVHHLIRSGAGLHGVAYPQWMLDYYPPMIREVTDGHPLIGNPWFFEHRNDGLTPTFLLPYWVSALPLLAGLPLAVAFAINFSLWSLVFGLILYSFFRRFGLPEMLSTFGAIVGYVEAYILLLRPVSMQIVYPVFLLFILAFMLWWERPADRYRGAFLGIASALTFYTYGYLYQITVVFLGLVCINLIYQRDWKRLVHALMVGASTVLLIIPFAIMTLAQIHHSNYLETMLRTGLVLTHSPDIRSLWSGICVLTFITLAYLTWRWIYSTPPQHPRASYALQFLLLGIAIEIVSLSNVITGLDFETTNHVNRFLGLWLLMGSVVLAYVLFAARSNIAQLTVLKKILLAILVIFVFKLNFAYAPVPQLSLSFFNPDHNQENIMRDQGMLPALQWLDTTSQPLVIWVEPRNTVLLTNILNYTKNYVLIGGDATTQLVSDDEMQERYLTASAANQVTEKSIAADITIYAGVGNGIDALSVRNREVHQCTLLRLHLLGITCGQRTDSTKLYAPLFASMYSRYVQEIKPHLAEELQKFHVAYVIKDTFVDTQFHPELLKNVKQVYSDGRFLIYTFI